MHARCATVEILPPKLLQRQYVQYLPNTTQVPFAQLTRSRSTLTTMAVKGLVLVCLIAFVCNFSVPAFAEVWHNMFVLFHSS